MHGRAERGEAARFKLVAFDDLLLSTTAAYLVKGLIPRTGLVVIWGPPKCGKSFWAFDLFMHVALGWDYRGRRVKQDAVVYLALEGAEGFKARAEAFRFKRLSEQADPVPFHLVATPVDLVADHAAIIASIKLAALAPCAVVIDTLNRSLAGSESKDEDMALYVRAADAIRDAFNCVVPIIHHSGIDATRPRGHTSLTGAADAQLAVKRDNAGNISVTLEWMKDGPEGDVITSRLEVVEVGTDEDGDVITSCVVVPADTGPLQQTNAPRLPKAAQIALRALQEALGDAGSIPPASNHIPSGIRVVGVGLWREYAFRMGISDRDSPDAKRMAFKRASETLNAAGRIGVWDEQVWANT